jgi:hypothetical protein
MTLDLSTPSSWPVRMTRSEIATVLRISQRELRRRVLEGRFPKADDGRSWDRDVVERYAKGGIKAFEKAQRRAPLQMVRAK